MRLQKLKNLLKKLNVKENFTICYFAYGVFNYSKHFDNTKKMDIITKISKCFDYDFNNKVFKIDLAY